MQIEEFTDSGYPALHHFRKSKQRAVIDILEIHTGRIMIERPVPPLEKRTVGGDAAKKDLKTMAVRVDSAGDQRLPRKFHDLRGRIALTQRIGRTDVFYGIAVNQDGAAALESAVFKEQLRYQ